MYFSLLALGGVLTAAGLLTIGFGIPINAFSLGNTLIIAGTTAAAAGIIMIGIAALFRQLERIALALDLGAGARHGRAADNERGFVPSPAMMPETMRAPIQPRPPEAEMPRAPEPRVTVEPRMDTPAPEPSRPLEWLRSRARNGRSDDHSDEVSQHAPTPQRPSPRPSPLATMAEPILDPKPWMPKRAEPSEPKVSGHSDQIPRAAPPQEAHTEEPKQSRLFDKV